VRLSDWWKATADRADAADPGALRRRHAARAALAALTAWLVTRAVIGLLAGRPLPSVSLFAVIVCFICALVIVDARRVERRLTLFLSTGMFVAALLLASLVSATSWLYPLALLMLIFAAYVARRYGLRPGELVLILTMGLYFAVGSQVTWAAIPWYLLAVLAGVGSLWLWQFVLLAYDPAQSLRASVRSFYDRAAALVEAIAVGFDDTLLPSVAATRTQELNVRLRQLKLSRRAIESQFPGALAPGGWQREQIGQLQLALYAAEQGLVQMVAGAGSHPQITAIPPEIRAPLAAGLRALQTALETGSQASLHALAQEGDELQAQVQQYGADAQNRQPGTASGPLPTWAVDALRIGSGSHQVARSIADVRALVARTERPGAATPTAAPAQAVAPNPSAPSPVRVLGRFDLHPTTVLGLQAVLATGLAMLLAWLLQVDHANWVFWTAFAVIAGSSGESLRKMTMRVLGTVGGVAIGVSLALLTPDNTLLVAAVATACVYFTIYYLPVSYPKMVFWLNIGFVMVFTRLGAQELDLLINRPYATLLGALVAAGVVLFVFPIRIGDRFKAAATQFLRAVDDYVATYVAAATGGSDAQLLDGAQARILATYAQLEQTLPSVAFENFPFVQADSPLTQQGTQLAALEAEAGRLALAAKEQEAHTGNARTAAGMRTLQGRIHAAIEAAIPLLGEEPRWRRPAAAQQPTAGPPSTSPGAAAPEGEASGTPSQERDLQWLLQGNAGPALLGIYNLVTELAQGRSGELSRPLRSALAAVNR
jgi:uncharacterized membrane protein YccC